MNILTLSVVLVAATISSSSVVKTPSSIDGNFELLILHNNDMHARFEQTSQLSGTCTTADREAGKCYGGFPRVATIVKKARKAAASGEGPPVLYLNAGDTYTGTAWFTIYKWKIAAEFVNALQPDAVSLGNHEFDEDIDGVTPFIRNLTTPVLAANLVLDDVPELQKERNLYKSIILKKNNTSIGIIGYLTPETKFLAPKNKLEYEDEIIAINKEVKKLKDQDVSILIALGHSGYIKDLEIAQQVDDIDLVIGGHSNTFLWNSNTTAEKPEFPQGIYPTIVTQQSGRNVLVVQAYAYTKYMGKLHLIFDANGEINKYDGRPILLNHDIAKDPDVLKIVNKYRSDVNRIYSEVVGVCNVFLDGECRLRECNLGNLITDSVVEYTKANYFDVDVAFTQGGRIRASIDRLEKPFQVTRGDWITVIPFSDNLTIVTMNGTVLMQALEHAVEAWRIIDSPGQFLQLSGMVVIFNLEKKPGSRVVTAKAKCSNCGLSELTDVNENYYYKVIMSSFLANTGDGFVMFESLPKESLPYNEVTCVLDYLNKYNPINPEIDGRITILNEDKVQNIINTLENSKGINPMTSNGISIKLKCIYYVLVLLKILNHVS